MKTSPTALGAQAGAAGLTTVLATVVVLAVAAAVLVAAGDLALTSARARSAADASALAGMAMSPLVTALPDISGEAAAGRVATANAASVTRTDTRGWPLRFRVTVEVEPATSWVRRIVGPVAASASAGVRPRTPTTGRKGVQTRLLW